MAAESLAGHHNQNAGRGVSNCAVPNKSIAFLEWYDFPLDQLGAVWRCVGFGQLRREVQSRRRNHNRRKRVSRCQVF